jgi:hypothetical protein
MSFDSYVAWLVRREQNKDRLREAERHRRVRQVLAARQQQVLAACQRQALSARKGRDRVLAQALTWLGRCLIVWGQRLQERYGVVVDVPALRAANQASN